MSGTERQADRAAQGLRSPFLLVATALVAASVAAAHAGGVADAAHDAGVARTAGLGWTGAWRALDGPVAATFEALPLGTRAFRAELSSACVTGLAAAVLFAIARRLLAECAPRAPPVLAGATASVATLTACLGAAWQLEGAGAGGTVLGALLAMAPLAVLALTPGRSGAAAFALGLAASYEPCVGVTAAATMAVFVGFERWGMLARERSSPVPSPRDLGYFALGLVPALLATARAGHAFAPWPLLAASAGERGATTNGSAWRFLDSEAGWLLVGFAVAGIALSMLVARARPLAAALVTLLTVGLASTWVGAPAGSSRFGAPVVAAFGALAGLGAVGMQAVVRVVAAARIPFARTSAALVVVLLLTFPVSAADDALVRALPRTTGATRVWDETAWGPLAAGSVLLLTDARLVPRVAAAHATGSLRGDLTIVPAFALDSPMGRRALSREPKLVPFWRDMELEGEPGEWSLSSLATARPLVAAYDARWSRELARHLVPIGLVTRFSPEPRGASDRRRALDDMLPARVALLEAIARAPRDSELLGATTLLLRARALALAASGDRELLARGLEDLFAFSPGDRVATELMRRAATSKGPIETKDVLP